MSGSSAFNCEDGIGMFRLDLVDGPFFVGILFKHQVKFYFSVRHILGYQTMLTQPLLEGLVTWKKPKYHSTTFGTQSMHLQ